MANGMTAAEHNNRIKFFYRRLKEYEANNPKKYDTKEVFMKEFEELYRADNQFKLCDKDSLLILLRLNIRYRFVHLHQFGLFIDLKEQIKD